MAVLGLLLILIAGATVAVVSWDETATTASFTVFDRTLHLSQLELFSAGAITGVVFLAGVALLGGGARRSAVRRRRLRDSRLEARNRVARLEREKEELERKLEETPTAPTPASPDASDRVGADTRDMAGDHTETTMSHPRAEIPRQSTGDRLVADRRGRSVADR